MSTHVYVESSCCAEVAAMSMQHRVPDSVGACITKDDDFVAICTSRAVLDGAVIA